MRRLTQKDDQGNWCLRGVPWERLYVGQVITTEMSEKLYAASWKLMQYEDTGLTPEAVERLKEKQIPVKPEVKKEKYSDAYDCPCCGRRFVSKDETGWFAGMRQKFCPDCGQPIDWGN